MDIKRLDDTIVARMIYVGHMTQGAGGCCFRILKEPKSKIFIVGALPYGFCNCGAAHMNPEIPPPHSIGIGQLFPNTTLVSSQCDGVSILKISDIEEEILHRCIGESFLEKGMIDVTQYYAKVLVWWRQEKTELIHSYTIGNSHFGKSRYHVTHPQNL